MSEALTVPSNNQALQGVGLGTPLFRVKTQYLELVQKTTRQEGAIPGKFRNTATGEHFDTMRVVLLDAPQEQREYYDNSRGFSKDSKICFSIDNVQPHAKAREPKALYCATCEFGDKMWEKWRQTKATEDLPKCQLFYRVYQADRATQAPYYLSVKGTSVLPFKTAMENQLGPLLQKLMAQAKQLNKQRGYVLDRSTGRFIADPEFILPEGKTEREPLAPMPNIFDISFELFVTEKDKGGPPVIGCRDFKALQPKDRAEFGALYQELEAQRRQQPAVDPSILEAEAEFQAAKVATTQPSVVLPGVPVTGEVLPKEAPITI